MEYCDTAMHKKQKLPQNYILYSFNMIWSACGRCVGGAQACYTQKKSKYWRKVSDIHHGDNIYNNLPIHTLIVLYSTTISSLHSLYCLASTPPSPPSSCPGRSS